MLVAAALTFALAGAVVVYAAQALSPASYTVSGTVYRAASAGGGPLAGATVTLTLTDTGQSRTAVSAANGTFVFGNVPSGGLVVNVTAAGFAPAVLETFLSPVYQGSGGGTSLTFTLAPGAPVNASVTVASPFDTLEDFVASFGAAGVLLGLAAIVMTVAGAVPRRDRRPAIGAVGAAAGFPVPIVLGVLYIGVAVPWMLAAAAVVAALSAFAFAAWLVPLWRDARPPFLDSP